MLRLIKEENIKPVAVNDATTDTENVEGNAEPEVPESAINSACQDLINGLIQTSWNFISEVNSVITTIDYDLKDETVKKQISELLNSIVDDSTINIGVLHKVFELLNTEKADLLTSGEEKAEEILDNSNN